MPLAAAERTHTAPIDGATTFDSPFSADLLAVWGLGIPLFARLWSGWAQFDGISGDFMRFAPVLRTGLPILSAQALPLCGFNCAGAFGTQNFVYKRICRPTHSRREPGIIARIPVRGMRSVVSGGICWRVCRGAIRLSPPSRPAEIDGNGKRAKR